MIFKKWLYGVSGATAIEYVLIASGISLSIVAAIFAFGEDLGSFFSALADMTRDAGTKV